MLKQLVIENKEVVIGDKCVITEYGRDNGLGPANIPFSIWAFKRADEILIGIHSDISIKGWSDLDGRVPSGHGLWITPSNFRSNMRLMSTKYEICTEFKFKNQNLKLMQCKILHRYRDGSVFIETDENVGGGSCDGLGKTGHCIILPRNRLKKIENKDRTVRENLITETGIQIKKSVPTHDHSSIVTDEPEYDTFFSDD